MLDVTALGELLIDFTWDRADGEGYPTMTAHPGGAPGNLLSALAAYGKSTAFLGKVGADAFGDMLVSTLSQAGIDTRGICRDARAFTTLAFVTLDSRGERSFSFARKPGADTRLSFEELDLDLIGRAKIFHFGTLSLTDEPARTATRQAVAYAKSRGKLLSCDPNLRLPLWDDPDRARQEILWAVAQADVVKISDEEVRFLWDCGPEEGACRLHALGASLAMVTLGPEGAYMATPQAQCRIPGIRVCPVDTTGAGDIFGGSALSRLLELGQPLGALYEQDLRWIGTFAVTAASLSTERPGGISSVPPREAVLSRMGK